MRPPPVAATPLYFLQFHPHAGAAAGNPRLFNSSLIIVYCRSQMRADFSAHSFISGASLTSTMNSTGYLKTATEGSASRTISRTTRGCFEISDRLDAEGVNRAARRLGLGHAVAELRQFLERLAVGRELQCSRIEFIAAVGLTRGHDDGADGHRLAEHEREMVLVGGVLFRGEIGFVLPIKNELTDVLAISGQRRLDGCRDGFLRCPHVW